MRALEENSLLFSMHPYGLEYFVSGCVTEIRTQAGILNALPKESIKVWVKVIGLNPFWITLDPA